MKWIALIGLVLLSRCFFSQQESIKIRKPVTQDNMTSTVTLCGRYQGSILAADLVKDHQLKISNNKQGFVIKSYELSFTSAGQLKMYSCANDTISTPLLAALSLLNKGNRIFIENIRAVTKTDTVFLNPISLKIE